VAGRVAIASLMYESNTFAPGSTGYERFEQVIFGEGPTVLSIGDGLDSIAGAKRVALEHGVELVPTTIASAIGGPIVAAGTYERLKDRLLDGLREVRGTVDGVYLQLHGAMVCEDEPDAEGDLIEGVVELMGVPVSVSLDLHAHVTARMTRATPLIAGFHTLPHVDMPETGERAMRMLLATIDGARPVVAWCKIPMLTSSEGQDTGLQPVRGIMDRVEAIGAAAGMLDASIFMAQPWLDVAEHGWTVLAVADGSAQLASDAAEELARLAWDARDDVLAPKMPIQDAIAIACAVEPDPASGPFVLADGADSVSAGCPGDGAELIAALAASDLNGRAQVIVTDAPAYAVCTAAGVGARVSVDVGGTIAPGFHRAVPIEGVVQAIADGRYTSKYPPGPIDLGGVAVVRVGEHLHVVITAGPACQLDYELYSSVGLDPRDAHIVGTKSAGGYRAYFQPIARECIDIDTTGPSDSRLERLPFTQLDRPTYPFQRDFAWTPEVELSNN
jgi:microcystin degradation protein MlrC